MKQLEFSLLNGFQRGFPLVPRPFQRIGEQLRATEDEVIAALRELQARGAVSRVGAVFAPGRIGAGTLAAVAAPPERLEEVAALVSAYPGVNHNYQREHRFNLWFVASGPSPARLAELLTRIETESGLPVIRLRLLEEFHVDLGFDLNGGEKTLSPGRAAHAQMACELPALGRALLTALQDGLEIVPRPFAALGARAGLTEAMAIELIEQWIETGLIKRFGVVVRHRELGYQANAMCVWDVPDQVVQSVGKTLAREPLVTLCYRRTRALPEWPYNLFCMVHGRRRVDVEREIEEIRKRVNLNAYPSAVLFSLRCFKQRGARYLERERERELVHD
jgi:DNA-binding Lrp family transcriptional regulator